MRQLFRIAIAAALIAMPALFFQNCSNMKFASPEALKLSSQSIAAYSTPENTPLNADLIKDRATFGAVTNTPSQYSVTKTTQHGTLAFDTTNATFTYVPETYYFGDDGFELAEVPQGESKAITRSIYISVTAVNQDPVILTDVLSFEMNSVNNLVQLVIKDVDNTNDMTALSQDGSLTKKNTPNGHLEVKNGQVVYTPNTAFRGVEQIELWAIDPDGGSAKKTISFSVGNPFREFKPALAIRGSGCITCHANVKSPFVTDLGFGNSWFAGQDKPASYVSASINLIFGNGNIYGDHGASSWASANIAGDIIVPKTNAVVMTGTVPTTLAQYYTQVESTKLKPANVVEKSSVYIGAPTLALMESRFFIDSTVNQKFVPNEPSSPDLSGLTLAAGGYYRNSDVLQCDGDVFLRGTLFLDYPVVKTKNGCRLHVSGPIFLQGNPTYQNMGDVTAPNNTNLQLMSARAIVMGVGLSHCETSPGQWYVDNKNPNPLRERFQDIWTVRSHVTRLSQDPKAEGAFILSEAAKLSGYKDASCYAGGRDVHLERILLNAPIVQSRMTGNVSGVVITEVALFALSKFAYEFDSVFTRVPVLPMFTDTDFLSVK